MWNKFLFDMKQKLSRIHAKTLRSLRSCKSTVFFRERHSQSEKSDTKSKTFAFPAVVDQHEKLKKVQNNNGRTEFKRRSDWLWVNVCCNLSTIRKKEGILSFFPNCGACLTIAGPVLVTFYFVIFEFLVVTLVIGSALPKDLYKAPWTGKLVSFRNLFKNCKSLVYLPKTRRGQLINFITSFSDIISSNFLVFLQGLIPWCAPSVWFGIKSRIFFQFYSQKSLCFLNFWAVHLACPKTSTSNFSPQNFRWNDFWIVYRDRPRFQIWSGVRPISKTILQHQ